MEDIIHERVKKVREFTKFWNDSMAAIYLIKICTGYKKLGRRAGEAVQRTNAGKLVEECNLV